MFDLYLNPREITRVSERSTLVLTQLLEENPRLQQIFQTHTDIRRVHTDIEQWVLAEIGEDSNGLRYFKKQIEGREALRQLSWQEVAAVRILDYMKNAGRKIVDGNTQKEVVFEPIKLLWMAAKYGIGGAKYDFFVDMLFLFRQFNGSQEHHLPSKKQVLNWMDKHPEGTETEVYALREKNKERILKYIIQGIASGKYKSERYCFSPEENEETRYAKALTWWNDWKFHLKFAVRDPQTLNEMLGSSLTESTMHTLKEAQDAGIPFFVNPYYLSLLLVDSPEHLYKADQTIRDYVFYSPQLIEEFGKISAWEKEDIVEVGKPNAAGWLLPTQHNLHRRYPEVAILIPDTMGRACGGLCVSCQRMYDFQSGHLNFNLDQLQPKESWRHRLSSLMKYYEEDAQLRDVLITGGDAFMNTNAQLKQILDAVYDMALRKKEANTKRAEGEKFAEMLRVRLGTRLPVYLPQRMNAELVQILSDFKAKASAIGFKQFVIQTHFITAMEITPEAVEGLRQIQAAGWMVANQQVFTAASSIKGHSAKLRESLSNVGVMPYYTFSVKGFKENSHNFATNARAVMESVEEKRLGTIPAMQKEHLKRFPLEAEDIVENVEEMKEAMDAPFLATDRNVMNIPGVGKSLTYRTVGITREGNRILEFEHDHNRNHSPIIEKMGNFTVVEAKSIGAYMRQIQRYGEAPKEYESIYGYSIGETEPRASIYEYPKYDYKVTERFTNLEI